MTLVSPSVRKDNQLWHTPQEQCQRVNVWPLLLEKRSLGNPGVAMVICDTNLIVDTKIGEKCGYPSIIYNLYEHISQWMFCDIH